MSKKEQNSGFVCSYCGKAVLPQKTGYRNHCPFCLYSLHVDVVPGDRASECKGIMKPVSISYNTQKGYQILHICQTCGHEQLNMRSEDSIQPDNLELILNLMRNNN